MPNNIFNTVILHRHNIHIYIQNSHHSSRQRPLRWSGDPGWRVQFPVGGLRVAFFAICHSNLSYFKKIHIFLDGFSCLDNEIKTHAA